MRVHINAQHPQPRRIQQVVDALERGGIIAYPTDSVYGLGCDLLNKKGLDALYRMKNMPKTHLLSFVCSDMSHISEYAQVNDTAFRVIRRLIPGPYTFILPATKSVPSALRMNRKTVGIRVPNSPIAHAIVAALGRPLVSTSASLDGEVFIDPDHIEDAFPGLALLIDSDVYSEDLTTVIDFSGDEPVVVRQGIGPTDFL